jgi:hypothetical protein
VREVVDLAAVSAERQKWRGCRVLNETGRADEQRDSPNVLIHTRHAVMAMRS